MRSSARRRRPASSPRRPPSRSARKRGAGRRGSQVAAGRSRDNPAIATFLSRTRLNKPGSAKETWHVEFDLTDSGIDYVVGDSFGVFPANDPGARRCGDRGARRAGGFPDRRPHAARGADRRRLARRRRPTCCSSSTPTSPAATRRQAAKALATGEDPDGDAETLDVLAAIEKFPGMRPDPEAFIEALDPLQPRLYSIASSPKVDPDRVALTVDAVRYPIGKRTRLGVASTFLADRVAPGTKVRVYVQKAQHFGLPADPTRADHHDRARHRRRAVPRLPARAHGHQGARPQLAVLRPSAQRLRFLLRGRARRHEGQRACSRACRSPGRATPTRRSTCRTACARSAAICGRGSPRARTSMSAATPSAWPRTSRRR